jgi:hypothetical protein
MLIGDVTDGPGAARAQVSSHRSFNPWNDWPRSQRRPTARRRTMTVNVTATTRYRTSPIAAHAYRVPVVRELPAQPVETGDNTTW